MTVAAPQTSADIIRAARAGGYALAAFNAMNLETAQAIVRAAEAQRAPVILQFSQNAARHSGLPQLAALGLSLKAEASVPVLLHFDHAEDEAVALQALKLGFDGVMLEGDDPATLRRLADAAHDSVHGRAGGYFEAEYEVVVKGERSGERHDDPAHLAEFIGGSGCDILAVDIGSAHKQESKNAHLDFDRLARLAELTALPLVLHGASSVPLEELARATKSGIAKINLATDLTAAFTAAVRQSLDAGARDPRNYLGAGRDAMQARAETYIRALGGAGRA